MEASGYSIRPLDEATWPAFAALVERSNGIFGGCWCMGFHPEGVGKDTTAELNRDRKLARVRAGTARAALVLQGDDLGFLRERKIGKHRWAMTTLIEPAMP